MSNNTKPKNEIRNWYALTAQGLNKTKLDANFNKHFIYPRTHVCCIGGTGSGKTTALLDFIERSQGKFFRIIIFSGSTTQEPLYEYLKDKIPEVEMYNDIEALPELSAFEDDKEHEKLIVFDDFITLKSKEMSKITKYFVAGRKYGFSCWSMVQNYTSCPKPIIRNINIFILFKLNDTVSLNNIMKNHILDSEYSRDEIKQMYSLATKKTMNFFMIDLSRETPHERKYRHNFLDFF